MKPLICLSLTSPSDLKLANLADLVEIRIDLIGDVWKDLVEKLDKPWIACNRPVWEGGAWKAGEQGRIRELFKAAELGAEMIDLEISSIWVEELVEEFKEIGTKLILSYHNYELTPPLRELEGIVFKAIKLGADVWKVATWALSPEDNLSVLKLLKINSKHKGISIAMGRLGTLSRIFCPLVGGYLTYASARNDSKAAPGQLPIKTLLEIYELMGAL